MNSAVLSDIHYHVVNIEGVTKTVELSTDLDVGIHGADLLGVSVWVVDTKFGEPVTPHQIVRVDVKGERDATIAVTSDAVDVRSRLARDSTTTVFSFVGSQDEPGLLLPNLRGGDSNYESVLPIATVHSRKCWRPTTLTVVFAPDRTGLQGVLAVKTYLSPKKVRYEMVRAPLSYPIPSPPEAADIVRVTATLDDPSFNGALVLCTGSWKQLVAVDVGTQTQNRTRISVVGDGKSSLHMTPASPAYGVYGFKGSERCVPPCTGTVVVVYSVHMA